MKKLILLTALLITVSFSYAQFGGGSGTDIDPYRIYSKSHLEELNDSLNLLNTFTGQHFRLMNNIEDSLTMRLGADENSLFNGSFHGSGYTITVNIDYEEYCALFYNISENGYLDSVTLVGNLSYPTGFCVKNYGTIYYCKNSTTNKTSPDSNGYSGYSGICFENFGSLISCINNSDMYGDHSIAGICFWHQSTTYDKIIFDCINNGNIETKYGFAAGIVYGARTVVISNCINNGTISQTLVTTELCGNLGGICGGFGIEQEDTISKIINCQNFGNVLVKSAPACGGIVAKLEGYGMVEMCCNYGDVNGSNMIGGICGGGAFASIGGFENKLIKDCLNIGKINGEDYTGGICGGFFVTNSNSTSLLVSNCLNLGTTNGSAICDTVLSALNQPLLFSSYSFFDKQLLPNTFGIGAENIQGQAEGKLTTQLTGTSPELQTMLGDGWSYSEGRYPIPLGLENDSMALVAATPVYLHFETEEAYNHVDSVSKNFTVGLENNVSWAEANDRVSFSDEDVTLLSLGMENLTVNLGEYSKIVRINIVDTEVSTTQQSIENGIFVYPNPAKDKIEISYEKCQKVNIEIFELTGKLILSEIIQTNEEFNISNLNSGIYLIKITDEEKNLFTNKLIKQ